MSDSQEIIYITASLSRVLVQDPVRNDLDEESYYQILSPPFVKEIFRFIVYKFRDVRYPRNKLSGSKRSKRTSSFHRCVLCYPFVTRADTVILKYFRPSCCCASDIVVNFPQSTNPDTGSLIRSDTQFTPSSRNVWTTKDDTDDSTHITEGGEERSKHQVIESNDFLVGLQRYRVPTRF